MPLAAKYASYFEPAMLTDREGNLTADMQELLDRRSSLQHVGFTGSNCPNTDLSSPRLIKQMDNHV
jgi:hypothetical protein